MGDIDDDDSDEEDDDYNPDLDDTGEAGEGARAKKRGKRKNDKCVGPASSFASRLVSRDNCQLLDRMSVEVPVHPLVVNIFSYQLLAFDERASPTTPTPRWRRETFTRRGGGAPGPRSGKAVEEPEEEVEPEVRLCVPYRSLADSAVCILQCWTIRRALPPRVTPRATAKLVQAAAEPEVERVDPRAEEKKARADELWAKMNGESPHQASAAEDRGESSSPT